MACDVAERSQTVILTGIQDLEHLTFVLLDMVKLPVRLILTLCGVYKPLSDRSADLWLLILVLALRECSGRYHGLSWNTILV